MKSLVIALMSFFGAIAAADETVPAQAKVQFETTEGTFVVELDGRRAPLTVGHVLALVDKGFYNGTVFHRVIGDFMIQGGGYTRDLEARESGDPIPNESGNGLGNLRGTVAMARTAEPHTASTQFYINVVDNNALNPRPDRWGYAVFGYVIEGMDVVDKIAASRTGPAGEFPSDVPVTPVVIEKAARIGAGQ